MSGAVVLSGLSRLPWLSSLSCLWCLSWLSSLSHCSDDAMCTSSDRRTRAPASAAVLLRRMLDLEPSVVQHLVSKLQQTDARSGVRGHSQAAGAGAGAAAAGESKQGKVEEEEGQEPPEPPAAYARRTVVKLMEVVESGPPENLMFATLSLLCSLAARPRMASILASVVSCVCATAPAAVAHAQLCAPPDVAAHCAGRKPSLTWRQRCWQSKVQRTAATWRGALEEGHDCTRTTC